MEAHLASLFTLRPDNPITETGVRSEFTHHGLSSRWGTGRADLNHTWMDPVIVAGPWIAAGAAATAGTRNAARRVRRSTRG